MAKVKEIKGVTHWPNGTIVYRIHFAGGAPVYPEGFAWEQGAYYAHIQAGAGYRPGDIFRGEAEFLQSVADDPVPEGWTRLVARLTKGARA